MRQVSPRVAPVVERGARAVDARQAILNERFVQVLAR